MKYDNVIVMATGPEVEGVWEDATVVRDGGTIQVFVPTPGGGVELDETFYNADRYLPEGSKQVFTSTTVITDSDGDEYDRIQIIPIRRCGRCGG